MILDGLNDKQKEAVLHNKGPLLVVAGAGSGKTRVLTTSIANLIENEDVDPRNILAITFTNKAANEMKDRVSKLLNFDTNNLWIGTFHSICARILRMNIEKIGYSNNFTIYDTNDQKTLLKEIINDLGYKEEISPKNAQNIISSLKNKSINPEDFLNMDGFYQYHREYYNVYEHYEKRKFEYNALDFDDLIGKVLELLNKDLETLEYYQKKFEYVFVDEYQDTNASQYELIKLFAGLHQNVFVVGDADQSIYSFRGADINNILNFEKDFNNAKIIKLEQNYRSTSNILDTANSLIANNVQRKYKNLWTENEKGDEVIYKNTSTESEESKFVVDEIKSLKNQGYSYKDMAILYRTNAQSRPFEESLMKNLIDYKVVGGLKFYDRKEIKDLVSYLKIIVNPKDDLALKRIINEPKRGIGLKTVKKLSDIATDNDISIMELITDDNYNKLLTDRMRTLVNKFYDPLKELFENPYAYTITDLIKELLEKSTYIKALEESFSIEDRSRIDNINEFISAASEYEENNPADNIFDYLENLSLMSEMEKTEQIDDSVSLMTMHAAKGLEFQVVFIVGLDEGLFPGKRSIDEGNIEEERRLFYVGITRACQKLYLTSSKLRRAYGSPIYYKPSRFIEEIKSNVKELENYSYSYFSSTIDEKISNEDYMREKTRRSVLDTKLKVREDGSEDYNIGDKIMHSKWGEGMIVQIKESEDGNELVVAFDKKGLKKLNQKYAPIYKV